MPTEPLSLRAPQDDLPTRDAGPWVTEKLLILAHYFPAFCDRAKAAPTWYYADAFAGPGINRVGSTGELLYGSPLLALRAGPPFRRCVLLEAGAKNVETLKARTAEFGDRAFVRRGDCNEALLPAMRDAGVSPLAPVLCLLDPEGLDVRWSTIQQLSEFRTGKYKTELLMLFDSDGVARVMETYGKEARAAARLAAFWGTDEWLPIWERKSGKEISFEQAWTACLDLYERRLRGIGYTDVFHRAVRRMGTAGGLKYHLVFASTNQAGGKIMRWCFDRVYSHPVQERLV